MVPTVGKGSHLSSIMVASPKSPSLTDGMLVALLTNMFINLMSRCTIPCLCTCWRAEATYLITCCACFSSKCLICKLLKMLDRSPPMLNFVTIKMWSFSRNFSMIASTFLWGWHTFSAWDSEMQFLCFSWLYLLASMALMATRPPVFFKKASKTWLFWPSFISLTIWYWSSFELNPWASRILDCARSLSRLV